VLETPSSKWKRLLVPGPSVGTYLTICTAAQYPHLSRAVGPQSHRLPGSRRPLRAGVQLPRAARLSRAQPSPGTPIPSQTGLQSHRVGALRELAYSCPRLDLNLTVRTVHSYPVPNPVQGRPSRARLGFNLTMVGFFFRPKKYLFDQNVSLSKIENQISP